METAQELEARLADHTIWAQQQRAQETVQQLKSIRARIQPFLQAQKKLQETEELLSIIDTSDGQSLAVLSADIGQIEHHVSGLEFGRLLNGKYDASGGIVSINAGAGGTESCDWVAMLNRMYTRWAQGRGFAVQQVDYLPGEDAGIKNVTFIVSGAYAYGYLRSEIGVHRLVRISPFDANSRRHTSFASVDVIPELDETIQIDINPADLKTDTFRAGGAGGQHVNKTDSAVRITHLPTGIVVQCQNERSQHKNKTMAMRILMSRLCEEERKKKEAEVNKQYDAKMRIEWGSQIRSYVFHPYSLVKDHRTDHQTSNVTAVMDGALDGFMEAYLRLKARETGGE